MVLNQNKNKIVNNKEEVKNVNIKEEKSDNNINNNIPKKLDLGKIFKGLNLENFSSMVKESKREEIIQFAQQQKEESLRKTKEPDNDSGDDADASDEEKEKEEEIGLYPKITLKKMLKIKINLRIKIHTIFSVIGKKEKIMTQNLKMRLKYK